jgi:hypothetical protein
MNSERGPKTKTRLPTRAHKKIIKGMRALRKRVKRDSMSVREMVNEGRRF